LNKLLGRFAFGVADDNSTDYALISSDKLKSVRTP